MEFAKEQITTDLLLLDMIYTVGAVSVVLIVLGLGFVDTAVVRRKNVLDTWVTKITASLIAGAGTLIGGVGIWNWQFNQAFGAPNPLWQALKDWWIGGTFLTTYAGQLSPDVLVEADVQQVFAAFFVTFSLGTLALIHTGAMERMKAKPLYVMALVIGLVLSPLVAYFNWGPVGPLTKNGTHDFDGIFPLYIFAGTWVLVLSWRLKPRLGAFSRHASGSGPTGQDVGLAGAGVLLIMFALPFVALASTWIFPGTGVYGISMTDTGWGIILVNVFASYVGGSISGAVIAYRMRQPVWALLGPIAGAVICGTLFDVAMPWEVFLISLLGPPVALATAALVRRLHIDEPKVIPLALGPGIAGALICGFVAWGTKTGGFPGAEGDYAFQSATITPWWQLAGVVSTMALAAIPCLIICLIFERTGGLRVTEDEEIAGLDLTNWDVENFGVETVAVATTVAEANGTAGEKPVAAGGA